MTIVLLTLGAIGFSLGCLILLDVLWEHGAGPGIG
jgi:hypothetical protein